MWFAWKFVPLWYQQQLNNSWQVSLYCCDLLENSYLCGINNNHVFRFFVSDKLWFAWKFVPLWYQQQPTASKSFPMIGCDLLENSYLCGINNNWHYNGKSCTAVVICLKIRTFVVSTTTSASDLSSSERLWFAWKFVPLWYQQQHIILPLVPLAGCDLLENSYLCGINNNHYIEL